VPRDASTRDETTNDGSLYFETGDYNSLLVLENDLSIFFRAARSKVRNYRRFITSSLGSVMSSMAYRKPSRPTPESLIPPYGM
jgi:hypothetical protein